MSSIVAGRGGNEREAASFSPVGKDQKGRKVFLYENNRNQPVRAAGVLFFYLGTDGKPVYLLQKQRERGKFQYFDLGGKIEDEDRSIEELVVRELTEETNGLITKITWDGALTKWHYQRNAKYLLITVQVQSSEFFENPKERMGEKETHTGEERVVDWVPHATLTKSNVNARLHLHFFGRTFPRSPREKKQGRTKAMPVCKFDPPGTRHRRRFKQSTPNKNSPTGTPGTKTPAKTALEALAEGLKSVSVNDPGVKAAQSERNQYSRTKKTRFKHFAPNKNSQTGTPGTKTPAKTVLEALAEGLKSVSVNDPGVKAAQSEQNQYSRTKKKKVKNCRFGKACHNESCWFLHSTKNEKSPAHPSNQELGSKPPRS